MTVPAKPKIYHIVHVDNLPSIVADGCLWPDSVMAQRAGGGQVIGNNEIKADRLRLPVAYHSGTYVGDYVPFYLCPRSVMLYVISRRNHPNVAFREGQKPVVHLMADMREVVDWATANNRRWAFTDINAANRAADFYSDLDSLDQLNWPSTRKSGFHAATTRWRNFSCTRVSRGNWSEELAYIRKRLAHGPSRDSASLLIDQLSK